VHRHQPWRTSPWCQRPLGRLCLTPRGAKLRLVGWDGVVAECVGVTDGRVAPTHHPPCPPPDPLRIPPAVGSGGSLGMYVLALWCAVAAYHVHPQGRGDVKARGGGAVGYRGSGGGGFGAGGSGYRGRDEHSRDRERARDGDRDRDRCDCIPPPPSPPRSPTSSSSPPPPHFPPPTHPNFWCPVPFPAPMHCHALYV
jgi:hypothetical protein